VIYSEARSASSCPTGVPMTLTATDLHHRKTEEEGDGEIWEEEIWTVEKSTSFSVC